MGGNRVFGQSSKNLFEPFLCSSSSCSYFVTLRVLLYQSECLRVFLSPLYPNFLISLHGFTSTYILGWSLFPAPGETPCVVLNYLKLDMRLVHQRIHYVYALLTLKIHGNFVIIARIIRLIFLLSLQESDTLSISVHSPLKAICIWWWQWRYWFIDGWWRWELCNQWSLVLWPPNSVVLSVAGNHFLKQKPMILRRMPRLQYLISTTLTIQLTQESLLIEMCMSCTKVWLLFKSGTSLVPGRKLRTMFGSWVQWNEPWSHFQAGKGSKEDNGISIRVKKEIWVHNDWVDGWDICD